jgi:hypothetical protein
MFSRKVYAVFTYIVVSIFWITIEEGLKIQKKFLYSVKLEAGQLKKKKYYCYCGQNMQYIFRFIWRFETVAEWLDLMNLQKYLSL